MLTYVLENVYYLPHMPGLTLGSLSLMLGLLCSFRWTYRFFIETVRSLACGHSPCVNEKRCTKQPRHRVWTVTSNWKSEKAVCIFCTKTKQKHLGWSAHKCTALNMDVNATRTHWRHIKFQSVKPHLTMVRERMWKWKIVWKQMHLRPH